MYNHTDSSSRYHTLEGTPVYIPPLTYIVNKKIIKNPNEFSG
jgi:hypothetical protein